MTYSRSISGKTRNGAASLLGLSAMCVLVFTIALSIPTILSAQVASVADLKGAVVHPADPPGTIDGAKNPELIPDALACEMLFLSLMEPEKATDLQKARQQAKLRKLHLSPQDTAAFLQLVNEYRDRRSAIDAQMAAVHRLAPIPTPGTGESQRLAVLQQQKEALAPEIAAIVQGRLSTEGRASLNAGLVDVKRHIKRSPAPHLSSYE
jgi:hypothetical protein